VSALVIFAAGCLGLGVLAGVQFGRWSAFLFPRQSASREVPRPSVAHAGRYVQPDRIRAGVCGLEPPDWFTAVP
jgi:hypothetical protein